MKLDATKQLRAQTLTVSSRRGLKKPKIVRNQLTKMFFDPVAANRQIQSGDGCRKVKGKGEQIEQFTFYGKEKLRENIFLGTNEFHSFNVQ